MPRWCGSPDFYFALGDLLLDFAIASPPRAGELLPMIEASWLRAIEIGEQPQLSDTVRGRGSFLAAHNLALLYDSQGDTARAAHWRERASDGGAQIDAALACCGRVGRRPFGIGERVARLNWTVRRRHIGASPPAPPPTL
jgi:hypothetical protein